MNKIILSLFEGLKNLEKTLRLLCLLFIMLLCLYWIQSTTGMTWNWMGFITPLFNSTLEGINSIYFFPFDFWGKTLEKQYFNALFITVIIIFCLKFVGNLLDILQELYEGTRFKYKKFVEKLFNIGLEAPIIKEEKRIKKYMLFVQTRVTKKHLLKTKDIDAEKQDEFVQKFVSEKVGEEPLKMYGGNLYYLNDFEKVDKVLDAIYSLKESSLPLEYLVCIQIEHDVKKIKKLVSLQEWNKVIISAETLYRYGYNKKREYKTTSLGVFQKDNSTIVVHEIKLDL